MPPAFIGFLVLQGLVFLLWAALAFRFLFTIRAEAVARTGTQWPGPLTTLQIFRDALRDPRHPITRRPPLTPTRLLLGRTPGFPGQPPHGCQHNPRSQIPPNKPQPLTSPPPF